MSLSQREPARILVVDDEASMREVLSVLLSKSGHRTWTASTGAEALEILGREPVDLMLSDLRMPGLDGMDLLEAAKARFPALSVILMTAFGTEETAALALRRGADDYLSKPIRASVLSVRIEKVLEGRRLRGAVESLRGALERARGFESLIGRTEPMRQIFDRIEKVAQHKSPVLITGESGTGKELVAKAIHRRSGRKGLFVAVNCGAIPAPLVESELFGHERGAFTGADHQRRGLFEEAQGGTLFLDEIGEVPEEFQVKLLRALQEEEIRRVGGRESIALDVRVIAATERDLARQVEQGRFRRSLYYRLNVVTFALPALRERMADVALLAEHFLQKLSARSGLPVRKLSPAALSLLEEHDWPGNVRELENTLERAVILSSGESILPQDLPFEAASSASIRVSIPEERLELKSSIREATALIERELIGRALRKTSGNRTHAAQLLGISHRALLYKLQEYPVGY